MSTPRVPLADLASTVQNAVQQALAKHGDVPIDKLWVGFVAPENIANEQSAEAVANVLARESGLKGQPSVAQIRAAAGEGATQAYTPPHRIIGLIYEPPIANPRK